MRVLAAPILACAIAVCASSQASAGRQTTADVTQWRVIPRESGRDDYYTVVLDPRMPFLRGRYRPGMETTVLGWKVPDGARSRASTLRWKWRAEALPRGGDECADGRQDSAAVLYVTWKRVLRWYTIKYVWSTVGPKGATCDRRRNPFSAQDTVILESGGPLDEWRSEQIDLRGEFRRHFEDGRADASVPDLVGLGIMSDGDATRSEADADYGDVVVGW